MARSEPVLGIDLTDRASFPHWTTISLRFSDMDRLAHINNVAIISFCETARVEFREQIYDYIPPGDAQGVVVVSIKVTYVAQGFFPGHVEVGTRVLKIGNSSYTVGQACFNRGRCIATVETVNVWADLVSEKSAPIPDRFRAALSRYTVATVG